MFIGFGTLANVTAVLAGSGVGVLLGHRLPERTRTTVTDGLGLVTVVIGLDSAARAFSPGLAAAVGPHAPLLIVLGAVLLGGIAGSLLDVEARLEGCGVWLRRRLLRPGTTPGRLGPAGDDPRARFVEAFVTASLIFCIGPLAIMGSLSDGLGLGAQQLLLKSAMDFFAAIAFAASLGIGVAASALAVGVFQGALTLVGCLAGDVLPPAHLDALTATGGLLLLGLALRLLELKPVAVGNLLPSLIAAPLLTQAVVVLR